MQDITTFLSNHPLLSIAVAAILVALLIVEFLRAKQSTFQITPQKATQMINHDRAVVIDIRQNENYRKGHIIDSYSITTQEMQNNPKKLEKFRTKPIIIVCGAGVESQKIAALLLKQGYNAYSLAGGIRGWSDAQLPLVKD